MKSTFEITKRALCLSFSSFRLFLLVAILCAMQWACEYNKSYLNPVFLFNMPETADAFEGLYNAILSKYRHWHWVYVLTIGYLVLFTALNGFHCQIKNQRFMLLEVLKQTVGGFIPFFLTMTVVYIFIALGLIAFVIPGIFALIYFAAVPGIITAEWQGMGASITRSLELTANHKWLTFKVVFCLLFGNGVFVFLGMLTFHLLGVYVAYIPEPLLLGLFYGTMILVTTIAFVYTAAMLTLHYENLKEA